MPLLLSGKLVAMSVVVVMYKERSLLAAVGGLATEMVVEVGEVVALVSAEVMVAVVVLSLVLVVAMVLVVAVVVVASVVASVDFVRGSKIENFQLLGAVLVVLVGLCAGSLV